MTHELLGLSVELLKLTPIPGLHAVAQTLLNIWDAVEQVDVSFLFFFAKEELMMRMVCR